MAEKTYIITFDPTDPTVDVPGLLAFIQSTTLFGSWWNHIPAVFLVTSEKRAGEISDALRTFTRNARMLVVEANPAESEGWLPDQSWTWVRKRSVERSAAA
jgi:hypothetical protein